MRAVDGLEGGLGGVGVEGAEEFAAGEFGDFAQGGFVEVRHHAAVADFVAFVVEDGERNNAILARADGVDGDAAGLRELGGLHRGEGTAVVGAVGEENHKRALAFAAGVALGLFEAGERDAEAVADGGAVFDEADFHALELGGEPSVVGGERSHRVGAAGEEDDADAVGGALFDERLDDGLDGLEAIDAVAPALVILGEHRGGKVDREDEVVALGADLAFVFDALRAGEGGDEQHEPGDREAGRPTGGRSERRAVPSGGKRHEQDRHAATTAEPDAQGQKREGEKPEGIVERVVEHRFSGSSPRASGRGKNGRGRRGGSPRCSRRGG